MSEPEKSGTGPSGGRRETRLEQRVAVARFGLVLLLLLVTFVFLASEPEGSWVPFVAVILQGATLLAALAASEVNRRLWRIAVIVVAIGVLSASGIWAADFENSRGVLFILNALLVGTAPVVIATSLVRRRVVDIHTVMGALCIYVLLGMLWAFGFGAIGAFDSAPFFAQQSSANVADYLYFSFVTLTTVGYGDLTAADGIGRAVAVVEALTGQLYLVTVVALVVSRMARAPIRHDESS
ncbi:MAG: potassium channel family protein [Acidimicrobiia bacterium]